MSPSQVHAQGFVVTLFKGWVTTVPDALYLSKGTLFTTELTSWIIQHTLNVNMPSLTIRAGFYFVGLFLADASVTIESLNVYDFQLDYANWEHFVSSIGEKQWRSSALVYPSTTTPGMREGEGRHAAKVHRSDLTPGPLQQGHSFCTWGTHTFFSELPRRLMFFFSLMPIIVTVTCRVVLRSCSQICPQTDRQIAGKMLKTASVVFPAPKGVSRTQFARMTHKYWLTRWKHLQPTLMQLVNTLLRLQYLSLHLFSVL